MTAFSRDRFTWLAYLMLAFYAYAQAALGPLMPFLRAELHLNYSVAALHLSAFALGMIISGLATGRAASRWGRPALFWGGGAGLAVGSVLLTIAPHVALTIAAAFGMGFVGTFLMVMIQAMLADRHGDLRAVALTESNVAASTAVAFAPVLIGLGEQTGIGWRLAPLFAAAAWLLLTWVFRGTPLPAAPVVRAEHTGARRPLPRRFWAYWLVILLGVSLEWCVTFWGADFLENSVGLAKVNASTLMSIFFLAVVIGRVIGSRMTRSVESSRLLIYAVGVVCIGFPLFWLGRLPVLNIGGLFIAGLGIANLYPLTLAVATSIVPEQADIASARISLASGTAILVAPQLLASFADNVGIYNAYGVAAAVLVAVTLLIVAGRSTSAVAVKAH